MYLTFPHLSLITYKISPNMQDFNRVLDLNVSKKDKTIWFSNCQTSLYKLTQKLWLHDEYCDELRSLWIKVEVAKKAAALQLGKNSLVLPGLFSHV